MKAIDKLHTEWQSLQPLSDENKKRLSDKFMLEFNYNSNHIEGNTLTYGQTKMLLFFGETMGDAKMRDLEEMKAHSAGLKWVEMVAKEADYQLTEIDIRNLNHMIQAEDYYKTDKNGNRYKIHVGVYKTRPNSVITATGEEFTYASPEETSAMMFDLVKWFNEEASKGELSPVELASLLHYRYIRIHPFEDGNGRIARLLINYVMLRYGYPMIIIKSAKKSDYLSALRKADINVGFTPSDGASASLEQIAPFVEYMEQQLAWSLDVAIRAAKGESIDEEEDWKKKLTLQLGDKKGAPRRTKELSDKIVSNVFIPLTNKIKEEISQFFPLFADVKHIDDCDDSCLYTFIKKTNVFLSIGICIKEEGYQYIVEVGWKNNNRSGAITAINKRYDETLNADEINTIINSIGKTISDYYDAKYE